MKRLTVKGKLLLRVMILMLTGAVFAIAFFSPIVRVEWQEATFGNTQTYYVAVSPFSLLFCKTEAQVKLADKESVKDLKDLGMTDSQIDELLGTKDVFHKILQLAKEAANEEKPIFKSEWENVAYGFRDAMQTFGGMLKFALPILIANLIIGIFSYLITKKTLRITKEEDERILKVYNGTYKLMDAVAGVLSVLWCAYLILIGLWERYLSLSQLDYTFYYGFFVMLLVIHVVRVCVVRILDYDIHRELKKKEEWTVDAVKAMPLLVGACNTKKKSAVDTADALLKYKQLLDAGALTQEEFEQKKKELLTKRNE